MTSSNDNELDQSTAEVTAVLDALHNKKTRWLLVVGCRLGANCGVPQPYQRTRWSPSIADLVYHHVFRTQSRSVFDALGDMEERKQPPLAFVADTLDEQVQWLNDQLQDLSPNASMVRLADLAKAGMFSGIITNAPDRLFLDSLEKIGVKTNELTGDSPNLGETDGVPLIKVWSERIFSDRQQRQSRSNALRYGLIEDLMRSSDGVLLIGHDSDPSHLVHATSEALSRFPKTPGVWVEQTAYADIGDHLPDDKRWRGNLTRFRVPYAMDFLQSVAEARGVPLSPIESVAEKKVSLVSRAMNRSFDIRPVLVYVPGLALFGSLINKLPRISLKAVLSILALLLIILGFLNYRLYLEFQEQVEPMDRHISRAQELLGTDSFEGAIGAQAELDLAAAAIERVVLPDERIYHFGFLHTRFEWSVRDRSIDIRELRDFGVTPLLYAHYLEDRLHAETTLSPLGHHPPIFVIEENQSGASLDEFLDPDNPRGIWFNRQPITDYRLPQLLEEYRQVDHVVLYSPSDPLLQVTIRKEMLGELQSGRLVFEVDLTQSDSVPLDVSLLQHVRTTAGYVEDRAGLFSPDGIIAALDSGACSFYLTGIDSAGVPRSVTRIESLLTRYPQCRAVIETHLQLTQQRIARMTTGYTFLSLTTFEWADAMAYLRQETSASYLSDLLDNPHLRWSLNQPTLLSLLIEYFHDVGQPPRSLGQLYERLLQTLLEAGDHGLGPKLHALGFIAHRMIGEGGLALERAVQIINTEVFANRRIDGAESMLNELIENGVLYYRPDLLLEFTDEAFLHLALAKHLDQLPVDEQQQILLEQDDEVMVFYAGLQGNIDALVEALMRDYVLFDETLRSHGDHLRYINPFLARLKKVAHAVQNGVVSSELVGQLEDILFELADHQQFIVRDAAMIALNNITTPGIRQWVSGGIEQSVSYDDLLLRFTAWSSDDIYVGSIERWLRRLGTDQDPRANDRFTSRPSGFATAPTLTAVANAFMTLVQVGSPDAVNIVESYLATPQDDRFSTDAWADIRTSAAKALLFIGETEPVLALLDEIQTAPEQWVALLPELYLLNNSETASALAHILSLTDIESDQPYGELTRTIKRNAAAALAFMSRDVAMPALEPLLNTERTDGELDYLPFVALSLGYRGDPADAAWLTGTITDLLERHVGWFNLANPFTREFMDGYSELLTESLALHGSAEAFETYQTLFDSEPWIRDEGTQHLIRLVSFFRTPQAEDFLIHRLLCEHPERETYRLIAAIGRIGTTGARDLLNKLVQIAQGRDDALFVTQVCGDGVILDDRLRGELEDALSSLVEALEMISYDRDLPRFAAWALSTDRNTRRAAIDALGHFSQPSAGRALMATIESNPAETGVCVAAMGQQGTQYNEPFLLNLLETGSNGQGVIRALRHCGGLPSLGVLYPYQDHAHWDTDTANAIHVIASRNMAESIDAQPLLESIYPPEEPPPPEPIPAPDPLIPPGMTVPTEP